MSALSVLAMVLCVRIIISDLYARRVPNVWLIAGAGGAIAVLSVSALTSGLQPAIPHVLGLLIGFCVLLPFYVIGWMGAGDVKFFATLGLLLGWTALLPIWIGASLLAGLHALTVYAWRSVGSLLPLRVMSVQQQLASRLHQQPALQQVQAARQGRAGIPYAAYLGLATIVQIAATAAGGAA